MSLPRSLAKLAEADAMAQHDDLTYDGMSWDEYVDECHRWEHYGDRMTSEYMGRLAPLRENHTRIAAAMADVWFVTARALIASDGLEVAP